MAVLIRNFLMLLSGKQNVSTPPSPLGNATYATGNNATYATLDNATYES